MQEKLVTAPYLVQYGYWPRSGRHILAQYTAEAIVVYQAYRPAIGRFAVRHHYFGGEFSFSRMSWIKPGFLWMMYRSGWASKPDQEVVLAVWLKREGFDMLLSQAIDSTYNDDIYESEQSWKEAVKQSQVRVQWDPDHDPMGRKSERRVIQLGLRGETLRKYAREWILDIKDISDFVREQSLLVRKGQIEHLYTPCEKEYTVSDTHIAKQLGILAP